MSRNTEIDDHGGKIPPSTSPFINFLWCEWTFAKSFLCQRLLHMPLEEEGLVFG